MGIKRLGRRRLAAIEKLGILKDISPSDAMEAAIVSATQHREGHKVITDIVLDLAKAGSSLLSKATGDGLVVSTSSGRGEICQITDAVFGIVTSVETICLEAVSDGTLTDFDLKEGSVASGGTLGVAPSGTPVAVKANIGTFGQHTTKAYDDHANGLKDRYLFLTSGGTTSQKATCTIDLSSADHSKVVNGITRLRMTRDNAATIDFVANNSVNFGDSTPAGSTTAGGVIGIGSVDNKHKLTEAISHALNETDYFSTDSDSQSAGDGTSVSSITVTVANVTATSNNANFLVDDPENASGITVTDFSGGIDDGQAMSSGKLLIRVTGFMVPDDAS